LLIRIFLLLPLFPYHPELLLRVDSLFEPEFKYYSLYC
jgi:hypothetical protein